MNKTRRTIGIVILAALAALGTGWAVEKAVINPGSRLTGTLIHPGGGGGGDATKGPEAREPSAESAGDRAPSLPSQEEHDRSDLLLSQG